jgi:tRNA ligase
MAFVDSPEAVADLVRRLEHTLATRERGVCVKNSAQISTGQTVDSWKFAEFLYADAEGNGLPSTARGLFIIDRERILMRGYDKFFNVGEIKTTTPHDLAEHTEGPYEVSLKENGCIILVGALADGTPVVSSKHMLARKVETEKEPQHRRPVPYRKNHALQGETVLLQQLQRAGIDPKEFGTYLYENNLTAVAELCDDDFDEHVLPYSKERSGLYLHGLNYNTVEFHTCPMQQVSAVGKRFGFHNVEAFTIELYKALELFFAEGAKTGKHNGEEVEGFVVRCRRQKRDFLFKYKFVQPYLLYRHLREMTVLYLQIRDEITEAQATERRAVDEAKYGVKQHCYISYKYIDFIDELFAQHPELAERYARGFGIIDVRKRFFEHLNVTPQQLLEYDAKDEKLRPLPLEYRYVLVPMATIGCGKTTTFQTLVQAMPRIFGHVQNDNLDGSSRLRLVAKSLDELLRKTHKVVCCDRNNQSYQLRTSLFKEFEGSRLRFLTNAIKLRFICCNFVPASTRLDDVRAMTTERVMARGDNHQSIKATTDAESVPKIMGSFLSSFQRFDPSREPDNKFDLVIDMKVGGDSSLDNAKLIMQTLIENYPEEKFEMPSDETFQESFQKALEYKPTFTKIITEKKRNRGKNKEKLSQLPKPAKPAKISYYGIRIDDRVGLIANVQSLMADPDPTWCAIVAENRVQPEFHVTLSHILDAQLNDTKKLIWDAMDTLFRSGISAVAAEVFPDSTFVCTLDYYCDVSLQRLVIVRSKLVVVEVEIIRSTDSSQQEIAEIKTSNTKAHITVGTAPEVKPFEANIYLEALDLAAKVSQTNSGTLFVTADGQEIETIEFAAPVVLLAQRCFAHR